MGTLVGKVTGAPQNTLDEGHQSIVLYMGKTHPEDQDLWRVGAIYIVVPDITGAPVGSRADTFLRRR